MISKENKIPYIKEQLHITSSGSFLYDVITNMMYHECIINFYDHIKKYFIGANTKFSINAHPFNIYILGNYERI